MRRPAAQPKPQTAELKSSPAPTGGWVANRNLAQPNTGAQGAAMLDNWFPTAASIILRRGSGVYATVGGGVATTRSLFSYVNGVQEELFAATDTNIYNITASPVSVRSGLTSGNWVVAQFATAGGIFLRGVNGQNTPFVYDGSTFGTAPALTFAAPDGALSPSILSFVWAYKNRLFFIQRDSLDAWYLNVDQIGGELTKMPLGGVFGRGGSLLFGAVWSLDSGAQGGLSEQCIFVTTEGEVAVFQGDNPSNAASWSKVGVYRIGKPLGPQAFIRAGGDLVIATSIGFVPLSQAIQRDFAALAPSAVSFPIEVAWNEAVEQRSAMPWACEVWPSKQMLVIALPTGTEQDPIMFVANARTGAWARFTGWDGTCLAIFKERLFFGTKDGKIIEANITGQDQGQPFTGVYVPLFDDLGTPASMKVSEMARATFRTGIRFSGWLAMQTDFQIVLPITPDAPFIPAGSEWGNAIWGDAIWGGGRPFITQQDWQAISGIGYALAPSVQATSGSDVPLDAELIRIDYTYHTAQVVS